MINYPGGVHINHPVNFISVTFHLTETIGRRLLGLDDSLDVDEYSGKFEEIELLASEVLDESSPS